MANEIETFHQDFFQQVSNAADAEGRFTDDAFFSIFCEYLVEAGEFETADRAQYLGIKGLRVDGYGGDPATSDGVLSLIVADFNQAPDVVTLTETEMNAIFKKLSTFFSKSVDPVFRNKLEETSLAFGLADIIKKRWDSIVKVRFFLITNRQLSARVDGRAAEELLGKPVTYSVWDIGRLCRFATSGHGHEEISIDLEGEFGGGLLGLPAHLKNAGYEAYLSVVPGKQLAAIYDRWGARLLEQNVRCFLQARGGVNKGIRNTIENAPDMFFAYNNGITATAESVGARVTPDGLLLTSLKNLQIVNGGQTTASIHAASRNKAIDLSKVFVQMKLSIVEPERTEEVVPKISEFANSQNRVNPADFFANHPFHIQMEKFSRRIFAPSPDGIFRESKWFYERARGQYQDERARLTVAQQKKFDLEYPKNQLISKTDLAKFLNVWNGCPDVVCKGAQKNFIDFAKIIGKEWEKQSDVFNETFYHHAMAKAIIFRSAEKIVTAQPWYQGGGLRAAIVSHAISKLAHDVKKINREINFESVWRAQGLSSSLESALAIVSSAINEAWIGQSSILEWAKQPACRTQVEKLEIDWPADLRRNFITREESQEIRKDAIKDQRMLNGVEAQMWVMETGGAFWKKLMEWGGRKRLLSPTEASILDVAASASSVRVPSEKQSLAAIQILKKLRDEGFQI